MKEIKFAWVCKNIHFNKIERVELTDQMLINRSFPSWIISDNCEVIAKIKPVGLKDKNGKEVWEGDIIQSKSEMIRLMTSEPTGRFKIENYEVRWETEKGRWGKWRDNKFELLEGLEQSSLTKWYEIIGNIYENYELLEVEK